MKFFIIYHTLVKVFPDRRLQFFDYSCSGSSNPRIYVHPTQLLIFPQMRRLLAPVTPGPPIKMLALATPAPPIKMLVLAIRGPPPRVLAPAIAGPLLKAPYG